MSSMLIKCFFSKLMHIDSFTQMSKSRVFVGLNMYCNYGNIIEQNLHVVSPDIYIGCYLA